MQMQSQCKCKAIAITPCLLHRGCTMWHRRDVSGKASGSIHLRTGRSRPLCSFGATASGWTRAGSGISPIPLHMGHNEPRVFVPRPMHIGQRS